MELAILDYLFLIRNRNGRLERVEWQGGPLFMSSSQKFGDSSRVQNENSGPNSNPIRWLSEPRLTERIAWGFVAIGILLRLRQFLFDRSLWLDESFLALNIIHRSPAELLNPLDYNQGAPIGFLLLEKLALSFGSSEMALRLFPFVAGIAALFLFKAVADRFLLPTAVPIAVALFAILDPLIYYSAEAKQYSGDVAIALLLFLLADFMFETPFRIKRTVVFSVVAAIAIWFSHPAVFILAGSGIALLWILFRNHDRRSLVLLSVPGALCAASFLIFYLVSLRRLSANANLLAYWQDAFPPIPPSLLADGRWFVDSFFGLFSDVVGLEPQLTGLAAVAFVIGAGTLFSQHRARFLLLLAPMAFTLLAAAFHRYPFRGRLLLFLVPSLILLVVAGLATIRTKTRQSFPLLSVLLIGFLFFHPALHAAVYLVHPRTKEEIKPVIEYVRNHRLPGDDLFVYFHSAFPFRYYSERHLIEPLDEIVGKYPTDDWQHFRGDLDQLRGKRRVWVVLSHVYPFYFGQSAGFDGERLVLDYLEGMGTRLDSVRAAGASAYLFDFQGRPPIEQSVTNEGR
jgi:uncharacterized membrane protein